MSKEARYKRLLNSEVNQAAVLTLTQFKNLLVEAGCRRYGERNVALVWHSFGSALRVTEIAQLKVGDVLARDGSIRRTGWLPATYTKNGLPRLFVQAEPDQHEAIRRYVAWRVAKRLRVTGKADLWSGLDPKSHFYIARGTSGFSLTRKSYDKHPSGDTVEYWVCSSLQQLLTDLIVSVGVINGSSHSGRRTLATRLDARGVSDEMKQLILGHRNPQQTMAYIDPLPLVIAKAVRRIYPGL